MERQGIKIYHVFVKNCYNLRGAECISRTKPLYKDFRIINSRILSTGTSTTVEPRIAKRKHQQIDFLPKITFVLKNAVLRCVSRSGVCAC